MTTTTTAPAYTLRPGSLVVERDGAVLTVAEVRALHSRPGRVEIRFTRYGAGPAPKTVVRADALVRVQAVAS